MTYRAPVADIAFALKNAAGFGPALAEGLYGDLGEDVVEAVLEEAGRFATDILGPLNSVGDRHGTLFKDGAVTTSPGWKEAYHAWSTAGWNGLAAPAQWGGQALPHALNAACIEMWNSAAMAFGLGPVLTMAGVDALVAHGSDALKQAYLPKLISGEWMGTMQLTEPQAGSDVGALRTKAARLPDAPPGTRGISLFVVPKFLLNADGSLAARNDVRAHSIEHKLGIHASPTCTMVFGDQGGATGFLVGEENRGMACMFTMMNQARLSVGLQGVAIAERATQQALDYARERKQGRATDLGFTRDRQDNLPKSAKADLGGGRDGANPIIAHPDVKRMLLTMRALTRAARALCYSTAVALDRAERGADAAMRTAADERASLLTPVAKAFSTDIGIEVASLGVQVHGGMGFIEETGAAQHYRDARIATIYEGTNGIQAIDLVTRKLPLSGGGAVRDFLEELRGTLAAV